MLSNDAHMAPDLAQQSRPRCPQRPQGSICIDFYRYLTDLGAIFNGFSMDFDDILDRFGH